MILAVLVDLKVVLNVNISPVSFVSSNVLIGLFTSVLISLILKCV